MRKLASLSIVLSVLALSILPIYAQEDEEATTESSDIIRERVQDKVNQARNVPYAYIGSVTDISENTLQLKADTGEIRQVSTTDDATFVNTVTDDVRTVEFSDVAIGDFVVAMGYRNGNTVLEASRVLITTTVEEPDRESLYGTVSSIESREVGLETTEGEVLLVFPVRWKGPDLSDLSEGDSLIAVGTRDEEDNLDIRTIDLVNGTSEE